jgi:hypothetical protein
MLRLAAKLRNMAERLIGSREAAAMLSMNRAHLNELARQGRAPGLVRKEPGGYGNRGRYLFDADVIERLARDRIERLTSALDETRVAS